MGHREADFYALFWEATTDLRGPVLLVRAVRDRKTADAIPLWESLEKRASAVMMVVEIPRKGGRPGWKVRMFVRFGSFEIAAPMELGRGRHQKPGEPGRTDRRER